MEKEKIEIALNWALNQIEYYLNDFTTEFPYSHSENNFYKKSENIEWTTGFWTGELWLGYEYSKAENLLNTAKIQVKSFLERIEKKIDINHHDMGFLYTPSCVAAYKLTKNKDAYKAAILAADNLINRFQEKGQFLQAWGDLGEKENYRLIIDCLLNVPLLFWATEVSGNNKYKEIATAHIKTAMKVIIRENDSTYHTFYFDKKSGLPTHGVTHQGNRDGSAWSRGQAWGIYGAALAYRYLGDENYLNIFKRLTSFFINNLPEDKIPYWDFDFSEGSKEPRDSSSLAIAICGILEMSRYLNENESKEYVKISQELLEALIDECAVKDIYQSNGLLLHGTYARKSENNPCNNRGVDECNTWGDYFYLEALIRMNYRYENKLWNSYW
ncbi:MAG: glucoronyl hydrolase [Spirochaetia bacterium]|nr:glucoronyl hydrolase [Spirochaetia bacterium]